MHKKSEDIGMLLKKYRILLIRYITTFILRYGSIACRNPFIPRSVSHISFSDRKLKLMNSILSNGYLSMHQNITCYNDSIPIIIIIFTRILLYYCITRSFTLSDAIFLPRDEVDDEDEYDSEVEVFKR